MPCIRNTETDRAHRDCGKVAVKAAWPAFWVAGFDSEPERAEFSAFG